MVVVLGSIALMRYTDDSYFTLRSRSPCCRTAARFFVLAVLRKLPCAASGASQDLLLALPALRWACPSKLAGCPRRIAELADNEADAGRFLEQSLREVVAFAWVRGAAWHSPDGDGNVGEEGNYSTRFVHHELEVVFHTQIALSPALFLHMRLLSQVVGEFYEGKRREARAATPISKRSTGPAPASPTT